MLDGVFILFFELAHGGVSAFEDAVVDRSKVVLSFFKLACVGGDEFVGQERLGEIGYKECGKNDVEWEDRFDAMGHEEGDKPVNLCVVAWSAQNTNGAVAGHFVASLSHALTRESWTVRCCRSTMPFAQEL